MRPDLRIGASCTAFLLIAILGVAAEGAGNEALHDAPLVAYRTDIPSVGSSGPLTTPVVGRSVEFLGVIKSMRHNALDGRGQIIAVMDSGVDATHRDLWGRVIGGHCFSTSDSVYSSLCPGGADEAFGIGAALPCEILPDCALGTASASLAAGFGASPRWPGPYDAAGTDILGTAPLAMLYPIKIMSQPRSGDAPAATVQDLHRAMQHVYENRDTFPGYRFAAVTIGLNSITLPPLDEPCDDTILAADVALLRSVGIATVISAGDNGDKTAVAWPACISDAIVVASSNLQDEVSSFSNFGSAVDFFAPGESLDVAAPGDMIERERIGTALAAAHVAGAIALLKSAPSNPSLEDVEGILRAHGLPIRVGSVRRPRIRLDRATAAVQAGRLVASPSVVTLYRNTAGFRVSIGLRTPQGSVSWRVFAKPAWIDVSGESGATPANPSISVWLNELVEGLPDGAEGHLILRNITAVQPDIIIKLRLNAAAPSPTSLRVTKLNHLGVAQPVRGDIMQADIVLSDTGPSVENLGFPPERHERDWGFRAISASEEMEWEFADLPKWLTASKLHGRIAPQPMEDRTTFQLDPREAVGLVPGQRHLARFFIRKKGDSSKSVRLEAELYIHRPPSDFFRLDAPRGPVLIGPVGGPFVSLDPSIDLVTENVPVQWELSNLPKWLSVTQTTGLAPATLTFSASADASTMGVGEYSTHIVFRNLSGFQQPTTSVVTLVVTQP